MAWASGLMPALSPRHRQPLVTNACASAFGATRRREANLGAAWLGIGLITAITCSSSFNALRVFESSRLRRARASRASARLDKWLSLINSLRIRAYPGNDLWTLNGSTRFTPFLKSVVLKFINRPIGRSVVLRYEIT